MATGNIFISQKNTVYSREHINRVLKDVYPNENVTTHTLRKLFGIRYIEMSVNKDSAMSHLSQHYGHNSINITKTYLNIIDETMDEYDVYNKVDREEYTIHNIKDYRDIIPTKTMGIYFLYGENKDVLYIGKSIDCIRQRINHHYEQNISNYLTNSQKENMLSRRENYMYFSYIPMDKKLIDSKEVEYIKDYEPVYNREYLYGPSNI